jgi:hypothetical protein
MPRPLLAPRRLQAWPELLAAHLAAGRHRPFAWGVHDCATFVADWVRALHGTDPLAAWRGSYDSEAGFDALVAPAGGLAGFVAGVATAQGFPSCPPAFVQRGDVALVRLGNEECLGLVDAKHVAVPTLAGIRLAPRSAILQAWAV